jgi:flagellar FliL protein
MADKDNEESNNKGGNSTMKIVIVAVVVSIVLSGGIAGGVVFLLGGDDKSQQAAEGDADGESAAAASAEPPIYHSMDPKFVVSFRDQKQARFMQFSLEVMARDREVIDDIEEHNPAIRSNLLMLVDNQSSEEMNTREGKEQLLVEITKDINQTLDTVGGKSGVEAAYYHSFVIQ